MKSALLIILALAGTSYGTHAQNIHESGGNVGIGTDAPNQKLTIKGGGIGFDYNSADKKLYSPMDGVLEWMTHNAAGEHAFSVSHQGDKVIYLNTNGYSFINGGNLGIGTNTPGTKLEIAGQVNSKFNSTDEYWLRHTDLSDHIIAGFKRQGNSLLIRAYDGINFSVNNTENPVLNITQAGNVGIGFTSPAEKLSVNGKIRAHEIKIETANWPDYVFAKEYKLPTLQEIEKHIKEKGHLPGIPTAAEVKTHGVDLGEMNAKLLQKIEELTLYMIEMKKENEKQKSLNQQFQMELLKYKIN